MKKEKRVMIQSVLTHLAERDPEWKKAHMVPKFKILWQAWCAYDRKRKMHSSFFYYQSWQRGWMPQPDFMRFLKYAMQ